MNRENMVSESNLKKSSQKVQDALHAFGLELVVKEFPDTTRTAQQAADTIGCQLGQIAKSLETLVDQDLMSYESLWAAAGTPNAVFELNPEALIKITNGKVVQIA